jgi:hypothetical protein
VVSSSALARFTIGWCTDWVVYRLGGILGSVGHRVKIHKITPATGIQRGDLEIKDYVVLQKPQEQADRLPPPRTLILDLDFDSYALWKITCAFYRTADEHKMFGWCS